MNNKSKEELKKDNRKAKDLCYKYNKIKKTKSKKREKLIKKIFGKTGEHISVETNFWCDYGYNISVGENFYMNHNCIILDCEKVEFGDNVLVGPNSGFYAAGHPLDKELRKTGAQVNKPIKVGNNVWIGGNVVVLQGVTIGDNVIVGAGSVVTKDIPANTIACGNPCKVIKEIYE